MKKFQKQHNIIHVITKESYPKEKHYDNGHILPAYKEWREKGMTAPYAIRYPVGFENRHCCLFSLKEENSFPLNYIESRKAIYVPSYCDLVRKQSLFDELKIRLNKGENLLLLEIDGPHSESLPYYQKKYGVDDSFIENNTMEATEENLNIMLNDEKHPFGHGYCLAMALLDLDSIIV